MGLISKLNFVSRKAKFGLCAIFIGGHALVSSSCIIMPDGRGTLRYENGSSYTGEFKNRMPDGRGTMSADDGSSYSGEWRDGKANGYGIVTTKDGASYSGEWRDGKANGRGIRTLKDGSSYNGELRDDKANGYGIGTAKDGSSYSGEWRDGKINGRGIFKFANGFSYSGEWRDSVPFIKETQGEFFYTNFSDDDGDGKYSNYEFKNVKNIFNEGESIIATSIWNVNEGDLNGKSITIDVLGVDTNKVVRDFGDVVIDKDNIIRMPTVGQANWRAHYSLPIKELREKVGGNKFRVIWKLDGESKKYAEFVIAPSQHQPVEQRNADEDIEENTTEKIIPKELFDK